MPPRGSSTRLVLAEVLQDVSRNGSDRKKSIPALWAQAASLSVDDLLDFGNDYVNACQRVLLAPSVGFSLGQGSSCTA
jgi:hypothetical protein